MRILLTGATGYVGGRLLKVLEAQAPPEPVAGAGNPVALVTGGAHPYFQPWKTGGAQAQTDFGIGAPHSSLNPLSVDEDVVLRVEGTVPPAAP